VEEYFFEEKADTDCFSSIPAAIVDTCGGNVVMVFEVK
jgi:hypothetical protein